jgi:hypothetical protein
MDENFKNAWEHLEHTYRLANKGVTTPFWYFADHPQSGILLSEISGSLRQSTIRSFSEWQTNIDNGKSYFIQKHGEWLPERPYSKKHVNKTAARFYRQKQLISFLERIGADLFFNKLRRGYSFFARLVYFNTK